MRGKGRVFCHAVSVDRITPAYAGKSHTVFPFAHVKEDHPRLCGEKALAILLAIGKLGSPPPMRGKAARFLQFLPPAGITPAYAGKSGVLSGVLYAFEDHPRLCGEKVEKKGIRESRAGSPPPMRGKDNRTHDTERSIRITPAYAGKRHRRRTNVQQDQDHPRLCGEKEQRAARISETLGSPPPMRGKGASWKCLIDCKGITPAYAGKRTESLNCPTP